MALPGTLTKCFQPPDQRAAAVLYSAPILITKFAADDGADGVFEGIASTPGRDRHGDIVTKGSFARSIAELEAGHRRIPLLHQHDPREQIGGITKAQETDAGLEVVGRIVKGTPAADRVHALAKTGDVGLSIGFGPFPGGSEPMPDGVGVVYKQLDLMEISAVSMPANRSSRILRIKELAASSPREVEEMLREAFPDVPGRLAKKMAAACLDALNAADVDESEFGAKEIAAVLAEAKRVAQIFKSRK